MNPENRIEEITRLLKDHVSSEVGEKLRNELGNLAIANYKPKHTSQEYFDFFKRTANGLFLELNHPTSGNHPFVWTLFTCQSQFVMGNSIEECFDKAMEKK
jgi:hypothetical protein